MARAGGQLPGYYLLDFDVGSGRDPRNFYCDEEGWTWWIARSSGRNTLETDFGDLARQQHAYGDVGDFDTDSMEPPVDFLGNFDHVNQ